MARSASAERNVNAADAAMERRKAAAATKVAPIASVAMLVEVMIVTIKYI